MEHGWILIIAMTGHVLCVYADRLLLCTRDGQFSFSDMKDNKRMAKLFTTKPESEPLRSIVLGTLAMFMQFFGYLALGTWMRPYCALSANIMIVGAAMIYTFGLAHHVLGCAAEWIYIKSDHTEAGRKLIAEFFGKTLLCGNHHILGCAFHACGGGNDAASRVGMRVQSPAAVSCAGAIQHSGCGQYRRCRDVPWLV